MTGYLGPRRLTCFGGPADGQDQVCALQAEHIQVTAKLRRYDLTLDAYTTTTLYQATYQPQLLQVGQGALFRSTMVLKYVPPDAGSARARSSGQRWC